jgi:hypothetical protein
MPKLPEADKGTQEIATIEFPGKFHIELATDGEGFYQELKTKLAEKFPSASHLRFKPQSVDHADGTYQPARLVHGEEIGTLLGNTTVITNDQVCRAYSARVPFAYEAPNRSIIFHDDGIPYIVGDYLAFTPSERSGHVHLRLVNWTDSKGDRQASSAIIEATGENPGVFVKGVLSTLNDIVEANNLKTHRIPPGGDL